MSPRAACRLETLGFGVVYDYVPGKVDWLAHGLPFEGSNAGTPMAGASARTDIATAGLEEPIGNIRGRVALTPYGFALVTSPDGVLLGRLRQAALEGDPSACAEAVMEAGPSTVRPNVALEGLFERMGGRRLTTAIVTSPEGKLLGVVRRADTSGSPGPTPAG